MLSPSSGDSEVGYLFNKTNSTHRTEDEPESFDYSVDEITTLKAFPKRFSNMIVVCKLNVCLSLVDSQIHYFNNQIQICTCQSSRL